MSAAETEARSQTMTLAESVIKEHCKQLHLPAVAGQCARLADQAEREHLLPLAEEGLTWWRSASRP